MPEYTRFIDRLNKEDQEFFYTQRKKVETQAFYPLKYKKDLESILQGEKKEIEVKNTFIDLLNRYYYFEILFLIHHFFYFIRHVNGSSVMSAAALIGTIAGLVCDICVLLYKKNHYNKWIKYFDAATTFAVYGIVFMVLENVLTVSLPNMIGQGIILVLFIITTIIRMITGTLIPDTKLYQKELTTTKK